MKNTHQSVRAQVLLSLVLLTVIFSAICSANELEVPYYTQDGSGWCRATSLSMVLEFYGYKIKPWRIASDFDMAFEEGPRYTFHDNLESYLEQNFNGDFTDAWSSGTGFYHDTIKSDVFAAISSGHPVYAFYHRYEGGITYSGHAIVITGCTGTNDNDLVYFHDPSGAFSGDENKIIYVEYTWADFLAGLDLKPPLLTALWYIYATPNKLTPFSGRGPLSVQMEPDYLIFGSEGSNSSDKCLLFKWDGEEPYDGYRYEPGSEDIAWPLDDDGDAYEYGYKALQTSTLDVKPTYSNSSLTSSNTRFLYKYSIYKMSDSSLVKSQYSPLSPVITEATTGNLGDQYNYILQMCELPEGVYKSLATGRAGG